MFSSDSSSSSDSEEEKEPAPPRVASSQKPVAPQKKEKQSELRKRLKKILDKPAMVSRVKIGSEKDQTDLQNSEMS